MESSPRSPSPREIGDGENYNSCSRLSHQWMSSPFSQLDVFSPGSTFSLSSPYSPQGEYFANDEVSNTPLDLKSPRTRQLDSLTRLFSPSLFSPFGKSTPKLLKKKAMLNIDTQIDQGIFDYDNEEKQNNRSFPFSLNTDVW